MRQYLLYTFGENTIFDTLEEAIEFADKNDMSTIQEIGGSYTTFKRCGWCDEWIDENELKNSWACNRCRMGIESRGETQ